MILNDRLQTLHYGVHTQKRFMPTVETFKKGQQKVAHHLSRL